jgi:two-component system response regulator
MNQPVRILYVDDYPLDRELVRDVLEKEHGGFEIIEAASRLTFQACLKQGNFDLVLSDFNILGFEGLQVLEAVQAAYPNLPVIIVTGTGSEEVAAEAIKRGAADYVIKTPRHIQRLPHTIQTVLEKKQLEDEHRQAQANLRASEEKFKYIFDHSVVGKSITLPTGEITVNQAFGEMLGYTVVEIQDQNCQDKTPPEI